MTAGYRANRATVIKLLNEALATDIVRVLRYKRHFYMASGINADAVAQEFLQHANEEQAHADEIAARIVQLGGEPDFSPEGLLTRSHAEYVEGRNLRARRRSGGPARKDGVLTGPWPEDLRCGSKPVQDGGPGWNPVTKSASRRLYTRPLANYAVLHREPDRLMQNPL